MQGDYVLGELVGHKNRPEWGPGKVVVRDAGDVLIYFRDFPAHIPEERVKRFAADSAFLLALERQTDAVLDCIPPFVDGKFTRATTSLTLEAARKLFLKFCPRGVADPVFWEHERRYKLEAHKRFRKLLEPHAQEWIRASNASDLRSALIDVYWGSSKADEPLNLMNPRFEWPAFKEALESDTPLLGYVESALAFAAMPVPDEATFDRYAEAVAALPARAGGMSLEKWTILTWLPFIANPTHHIFLKPAMTQEFASILPFELQYRSQLNHTTYMRLQEMAKQMKQKISDPEISPENRELDMIDVHSFMWIVVEYGK